MVDSSAVGSKSGNIVLDNRIVNLLQKKYCNTTILPQFKLKINQQSLFEEYNKKTQKRHNSKKSQEIHII